MSRLLDASVDDGGINNARRLYVALQSTGILEISFDTSEKDMDKSLSIISTYAKAGKMPGWLASYGDNIYSISRIHYPDENSESGGLFAFRRPDIAAASGTGLTLLNEASSSGKGGVHIDVSPDGKILVAANINGSTVSVYPLLEDGSISKPTHTFYYDEEGPSVNNGKGFANPHEARFDPSGRFLFVPLRGADKLLAYSVSGPEHVTLIQTVELPPKTGPRHTAIRQFDATTAYLYLLSEKDNNLRVFKVDYDRVDSSGSVKEAQEPFVMLKQTISLLEREPAPDTRLLGAEVAVTVDGKFLYASNRFFPVDKGDTDTLSIYTVNPADDERHLTYIGASKVLGQVPRMFALSNDENNRWVAVANELNQDIIVFERDLEKGFLKDVKGRLSLGENDTTLRKGPVCVLWK